MSFAEASQKITALFEEYANERVKDLRDTIDTQKKLISKLEKEVAELQKKKVYKPKKVMERKKKINT